MPDLASPASPLEQLPDVELVAHACNGHRAAFNCLVVRHERRLFRFLSRSAANLADIEDAMQQALVKAFVHLHRYQPKWKFTTWLFTIALRELRTIQRRPRRAAVPIEHAEQIPAAAPADSALHPQDGAELWNLARRVLTTPQFTALWLRYGEDLPLRDVAQIIGRPRIWVSVTLHRACAALRSAAAKLTGMESPTAAPQPRTAPSSEFKL